MSVPQSETEAAQRAVCQQYSTEYVPPLPNSKTGFAASTKGLIPINGLRHPVEDDTSGWYIWRGGVFSDSLNFFVSIHTYHLYSEYPEFARLLGLPPGYRFLLAGEHLDVWYDASLLTV